MASIYQKKALEHLESPEQLDHLIVVTPPRTWLIIVGAALILSAFLFWAFFGTIRTEQSDHGSTVIQEMHPYELLLSDKP